MAGEDSSQLYTPAHHSGQMDQRLNSTNYIHPQETNLLNIAKSMQYNNSGQPSLRTLVGDEYSRDTYHRPKVYQDYRIFSGEATLGIPNRVWEQTKLIQNVTPRQRINSAIDSNFIYSEDGMFTVKSGTTANIGYVLRTKDFFRDQPNRGTLFSASAFFPTPTAVGERSLGYSSAQNGLEFRIVGDGTAWELRYQRRRGAAVVADVLLNEYLPEGFDPSKGHHYDIQYGWGGVGDIRLYVDFRLIYIERIEGQLTTTSLSDSAMPLSAISICREEGTELILKVAAFCVSVEGGQPESNLFGSITTESLLTGIPAAGAAVLAFRVPRNVTYGGASIFNTRGAIADKIVTWTRSEAITQAWYGRDYNIPNLEALTWSNIPDSRLQYLIGGGATALNTAFAADKAAMTMLVAEFAETDTKNIITNPNLSSSFELSPGDVIVIFVDPINNNVDTYAAFYYSEQR